MMKSDIVSCDIPSFIIFKKTIPSVIVKVKVVKDKTDNEKDEYARMWDSLVNDLNLND